VSRFPISLQAWRSPFSGTVPLTELFPLSLSSLVAPISSARFERSVSRSFVISLTFFPLQLFFSDPVYERRIILFPQSVFPLSLGKSGLPCTGGDDPLPELGHPPKTSPPLLPPFLLEYVSFTDPCGPQLCSPPGPRMLPPPLHDVSPPPPIFFLPPLPRLARSFPRFPLFLLSPLGRTKP